MTKKESRTWRNPNPNPNLLERSPAKRMSRVRIPLIKGLTSSPCAGVEAMVKVQQQTSRSRLLKLTRNDHPKFEPQPSCGTSNWRYVETWGSSPHWADIKAEGKLRVQLSMKNMDKWQVVDCGRFHAPSTGNSTAFCFGGNRPARQRTTLHDFLYCPPSGARTMHQIVLMPTECVQEIIYIRLENERDIESAFRSYGLIFWLQIWLLGFIRIPNSFSGTDSMPKWLRLIEDLRESILVNKDSILVN